MRVSKNKLLFLSSLFVSIGLCEMTLRLARLPATSDRKAFLSRPGISFNKNEIEKKALHPGFVYKEIGFVGNEHEYTGIYTSDRDGYRTASACKAGDQKGIDIVIAGDSFTFGQTSTISWSDSIECNLRSRGFRVLNTSLPGFGLLDMKGRIDNSRRLGARKVVMSIISHDIYRPETIYTHDGECTYINGGCTFKSFNSNLEGPAELAESIRAENKYGLKELIRRSVESFGYNSMQLVKPPIRGLKQLLNLSDRQPEIFWESVDAVNQLYEEWGSDALTLVLLPTKEDRGLRGSESDRQSLQSDTKIFLESINPNAVVLDIRSCSLDDRHFNKYDGHPNHRGYKKIGECAMEMGLLERLMQ